MKLGRKVGNRRSIRSEDFFLEITMILGKKQRKERSNRSEDFFSEITMILGKNSEKRGQIEMKTFLGIIMILGEKREILFYVREHQVLEILASGP